MSTRKESEFLNGVPELLLLRLLARQPMHGYEIVQAIRLQSEEVLAFGEGCVYPVLHRLEASGHLATERVPVGGRSRVVYHLTEKGIARLEAVARRWAQVSGAIQHILKGASDAARRVA